MSNEPSQNYNSTLILGQKSMSGGVQENNKLNQNQVQIIKRNKNSILWFTHIMSYALVCLFKWCWYNFTFVYQCQKIR